MTTHPGRFDAGRRGRRAAARLVALLALFVAGRAPAAEVDWARESDPRIDPRFDRVEQVVKKFSPRLLPLWLEALARPEADLKRQAADAITRAHGLGMPGLIETAPRLVEELEAPDAHPVVRLAAARALITLDARQAAPVLMKHARADGFDPARLVEPALARWDYAPMRPVWLARLENPHTPRGPLALAIQAAAAAKWIEVVPHLRRLALDPRGAADVRLEAARSLAALQPAGLENEARPLAADVSPERTLDRLVAVTLLARHGGPAAEALLLRLGADREPAIATIAVGRLFEIDPAKLKPLLDTLRKNANAGLRMLAARALVELPTPEAVAELGLLLDDPHRGLRVFTRESLIKLAGIEPLGEPVRRAVRQMLETGGPRGLEQAVVVVGAIRYEPPAGRLLELLDDRHTEVALAAAWALRRLAVPATADIILKRVQAGLDRFGKPTPVSPSTPVARTHISSRQQLAHLIEALGVMRHRPAAPLFRKFLPVPPPPHVVAASRNPFWQNDLRGAVLWALGHIYAGDPPADLAALFRERLINEITPYKESDAMRAIMAVDLGRMNVKDAVPTLRQYYQSEETRLIVRRACGWALERITGEPQIPVPQAVVREIGFSGWFLEPAEP